MDTGEEARQPLLHSEEEEDDTSGLDESDEAGNRFALKDLAVEEPESSPDPDMKAGLSAHALLLAACFVNDAIHGRNPKIRTDMNSIRCVATPQLALCPHRHLPHAFVDRLYRAYKRWPVQVWWKSWVLINLALPFIEPPYTMTPPFYGVR